MGPIFDWTVDFFHEAKKPKNNKKPKNKVRSPLLSAKLIITVLPKGSIPYGNRQSTILRSGFADSANFNCTKILNEA